MSNHNLKLDMANLELAKQYLVSAFLSLEPSDCLISFERKCGCGFISKDVQEFIWTYCINNSDYNYYAPYLKNLLKKLIKEVESSGGNVLDEFYERYADYMASLTEDAPANGSSWIVKRVSFLFNDVPSHWGQMQMVVPLQCSLNMLQGDTGCALWPSSLFLSEFILSYPEVFTKKSCFEVGSGVGLLGVCLNHVKASQVILTDGDASSLENLKLNLEMNKIENLDVSLDKSDCSLCTVQCIPLSWESAEESELWQFQPDIVLGAGVLGNPSCLPHLVKVLLILLTRRKPISSKPNSNRDTDRKEDCSDVDSTESSKAKLESSNLKSLLEQMATGPVALIASVIRNIDTFNCFRKLCSQNNLDIRDITRSIWPFNLLPYMDSYRRSDVHLFLQSYSK
ncbi:uncharacterized protein LOC130828505 [Amaranthus tricolor]|uniref:uncharacterized protein LOC130828505 n=1 Tax=Amaranthus tricolor TaxID=29722 RepID=UPI00258C6E82|nr:uncharacterized protein LOC130828505 [Amaranthus tricolor]